MDGNWYLGEIPRGIAPQNDRRGVKNVVSCIKQAGRKQSGETGVKKTQEKIMKSTHSYSKKQNWRKHGFLFMLCTLKKKSFCPLSVEQQRRKRVQWMNHRRGMVCYV